MRIVFQESIPTFSKYFPWHFRTTIDTNKNRVEGSMSRFYLNNDELNKVDLVGVNKIWLSNVAYYGSTLVSITHDPMSQQLMNDALSAVATPVTFTYLPPNIIEIHPYVTYLNDFMVEVSAIHPTHMKSIPPGMRESFYQLAYLDVLVSLLPLRKRFESISSVYGDIRLFLDAVDSSVNDRKELLDKFQENILKDSDAKRIWIA